MLKWVVRTLIVILVIAAVTGGMYVLVENGVFSIGGGSGELEGRVRLEMGMLEGREIPEGFERSGNPGRGHDEMNPTAGLAGIARSLGLITLVTGGVLAAQWILRKFAGRKPTAGRMEADAT